MKKLASVLAIAGAFVATGCATTAIDNSAGRASAYEDVRSASAVQGAGIESNDIATLTDQMVRDILSNPMVMNRGTSPRIILDSEYLINESSSRINKNMLTDRLRNDLRRAANGKLLFLTRENIAMVEKERELKRRGVVDSGTIRQTQATGGADFRIQGRITSLDSMQQGSQMHTRYHQISFELVDLELGTIVWGDMYEFRKTAQDDIMYR